MFLKNSLPNLRSLSSSEVFFQKSCSFGSYILSLWWFLNSFPEQCSICSYVAVLSLTLSNVFTNMGSIEDSERTLWRSPAFFYAAHFRLIVCLFILAALPSPNSLLCSFNSGRLPSSVWLPPSYKLFLGGKLGAILENTSFVFLFSGITIRWFLLSNAWELLFSVFSPVFSVIWDGRINSAT